MNHTARLRRIEDAARAQQEAQIDAFDAWTALHWTEAEQEAWRRYLITDGGMPSDAGLAEYGLDRAEVAALIADTPPLDGTERALLAAALARVPPALGYNRRVE
jgi:hypothetical protein